MPSRFDSDDVQEWMNYIQTLHAREIELTLDRVRSVYTRLCPRGASFKVISVAGTNGKGSTAEVIRSIYHAAGYRVAKFTSPHLIDLNERFSVGDESVSDADLLAAFKRIEKLRGDTPITYFEYGLLLAIAIFEDAATEVAVMEVGLGGRLDAVNILDADVAIVTSIALDHTDWLGDTLEKIAYEKAGIARAGSPCLVGIREPQRSITAHLDEVDADGQILGIDFDYKPMADGAWCFSSSESQLEDLPLPFGQNGVQLSNASLAIRAVQSLNSGLPVDSQAIVDGLNEARLAGRCQIIAHSPIVVLDVSHNEASLKRLRTFLDGLSYKGRLVALCGMLKDKEIEASLSQLADCVDEWHLATINNERGANAEHLLNCLQASIPSMPLASTAMYDDVQIGYKSVEKTLTANDCLVVFGSFYIAGDILTLLHADE